MYELFRGMSQVVLDPHAHLIALIFLLILSALLVRTRFVSLISVGILLHLLFFGSRFSVEMTLNPLEKKFPVVETVSNKDAVVVLTGGTIQFHPESMQYLWLNHSARFLEAVRLFKKSGSKYFVILGATPDGRDTLESEASSMRRMAIELGIQEERIFVDPISQTTARHSEEFAPIASQLSIQSFYLVTSAFHLPRAVDVFRKSGYDPTPFPVDYISIHLDNPFGLEYYALHRLILHEWVGSFIYKLKGFI